MCIVSGDVYRVSGSVGAAPTAMAPRDIAVDTCNGFNIIAHKSLLPGCKKYKVLDAHETRLAKANKSPLALSGAV